MPWQWRIDALRWQPGATLLSALALVFLATYSTIQLTHTAQEDQDKDMHQVAHGVAAAVGARLSSGVASLVALSTSSEALRNDLPGMYSHAQRMMKTLPEASAVSLVDPDGRLVFLTLRRLDFADLPSGDPAAAAKVFDTRLPAVSGPFKAPISDNTVTTVAVPVFQGGQVAYCMRLVYLTKSFDDLLAVQKLPSGWTVSLMDRGGALIARSRQAGLSQDRQAPASVVALLDQPLPQVLDVVDPQGQPVRLRLEKLPQWDWSLALEAPPSSLRGDLGSVAWPAMLLGLALIGLGTLAAWWRLGKQTTPTPRVEAAALPLQLFKGGWPALLALMVAMAMTLLTALHVQSRLHQVQALAEQRLQASVQLGNITELLSMFKDLETGQRGFAITGRENFLEPHNTALTRIPPALAALRNELTNGPARAFAWKDLEALADSRQAEAARVIAERRARGDDIFQDDELFDRGKLVMDKLRLQFATLESLLNRHVETLSADMASERTRAVKSLQLASLAVFILVMVSIGFGVRERLRSAKLFEELATSHAQLERRVEERTRKLVAASARLRSLASEAERNIETERRRLSREVHDQIGQVFTGIKMILRTLRPGSLVKEQQSALDAAIDMGVKTTRRIAAELRPPLLDDLGLRAALDYFVRVNLTSIGISHEMDVTDDEGLSDEQRSQVFRIVQEACTNILRHAQASHVSLTGGRQGQEWALSIRDNGVGFDLSAVRPDALGLLGIQERAQMLGGTTRFSQAPGGGTQLTITVPLPTSSAAPTTGANSAT